MKSWHLICYRERLHNKIKKEMSDIGMCYFMPLYVNYKKRTDRENVFRRYLAPLFPGYLFLYFSPEDIHTTIILKQPSVIDFVRSGHKIQKIPDELIFSLKMRVNHSEDYNIFPKRIVNDFIEKMLNEENPLIRKSLLMSLITDYSERSMHHRNT
jgi:Transcription antiterminator